MVGHTCDPMTREADTGDGCEHTHVYITHQCVHTHTRNRKKSLLLRYHLFYEASFYFRVVGTGAHTQLPSEQRCQPLRANMWPCPSSHSLPTHDGCQGRGLEASPPYLGSMHPRRASELPAVPGTG